MKVYGYEIELMNDNRKVIKSKMPMTRTEASTLMQSAYTYYTVTHPQATIISMRITEREK